jgi:hypothetical protein
VSVSVNLDERWFVCTVALRAKGLGATQVKAGLHVCDGFRSEAEAVGAGFQFLKQNYPENDGWQYQAQARQATESVPEGASILVGG